MLVYSLAGSVTGRDVWMLPAGDSPTPFLTTPRDERAAMFSPDGRWVVYAAKEPAREEEVYVQPYSGPGGRTVVSRGGGIEPVWSPTGGEIFYRSVDGRRMMAVAIATEPTISVEVPRQLMAWRVSLRRCERAGAAALDCGTWRSRHVSRSAAAEHDSCPASITRVSA